MKGISASGAPTASDCARLVLARASAKLALERADAIWAKAVQSTFQTELAGTVRRASTFLVGLLAQDRLSLDTFMPHLTPLPGWPFTPGVSRVGGQFDSVGRLPDRHDRLPQRWVLHWPEPGECFGVDATIGTDTAVRIHVVDHSIEVAGRMGDLMIATMFGTLRLSLPEGTQWTRYIEAVRRPLEDVIDHPVLRGRGWRVEAVEAPARTGRPALLVRTGSQRYAMPWARPR